MNMPLMLDLTNKKVVVVGGGKIATRRIKTLLNYTEHIHVVSPAITNQIAQWVETQRITHSEKRFEPTDIEEVDMVVAATNHSEVNEEVRLSVPKHVLFNHAEQAELGNVTFPNVFRRDRLTISVCTEGASPKLGQRIINHLEDTYNEEYATYVQFLYESRQYIKALSIEPSDKHALLEQILSDTYLDENKQHEFIRWLQSQV
ncbi:NAD(P)-binding protein [Staphylococcus capitis]|uniref:NAD(P)-binding protein n=1 Tax=Staphylococcus capitis TaxID=29388 RepID=UPI000BFBEC58|nr:NAD(P)-binding protein [Staphylococcus capitis]ATN01779.1 precorrin-2 dehydrogenase [Staphylococcus capitis]GMX40919.1 NAD(P)-binding protein [Streptococcus canis]